MAVVTTTITHCGESARTDREVAAIAADEAFRCVTWDGRIMKAKSHVEIAIKQLDTFASKLASRSPHACQRMLSYTCGTCRSGAAAVSCRERHHSRLARVGLKLAVVPSIGCLTHRKVCGGLKRTLGIINAR